MSNYSTREWFKDQAAAKAISDMGNTVSTVVAQRNQAQQKVNELEKESDDLIENAMRWVNYAKKLESQLAERDALIAELKEENDNYMTEGINYRKKIWEQEALIAQQADLIAELQAALANSK